MLKYAPNRKQLKEARKAADKESDDESKPLTLACAYRALGRRAESDSAVHALERGFANRDPHDIAAARAYRGEADAAFTWLGRAYEQAKGSLESLRINLLFRTLHSDPRIDALLRKAKLTQ